MRPMVCLIPFKLRLVGRACWEWKIVWAKRDGPHLNGIWDSPLPLGSWHHLRYEDRKNESSITANDDVTSIVAD